MICQKHITWKRLTSPIRLKLCSRLFPTNENHSSNFCPYKETLNSALRELLAWISLKIKLFKMAPKAKKLSVMKIRQICVPRKASREEVVLERVSGELAGISKVYLDSCNGEFESIKCCGSLSTSVIKRSSKRFVDLFSERIKFTRDKTRYVELGVMNM